MSRLLVAVGLLVGLSWAGSLAAAEKNVVVGRQIDGFKLADVRGKQHSLADFKEQKLLVVAFVGTECPLAKQYTPRLVEIAAKYKDKGVGLIAVASNQQDSLAELNNFERVYKIEFPLLKDGGNVVADQFSAERTPEVFVLDADRKVRYHGRIDDQFTYGRQKTAAEKNYLCDALDELLAGKEVSTASAESIGCHIGRVLKPQSDSKVTYSNQISRLFNSRCVECHRAGEIGPFTLGSYEDAVGWAEMIAEVVREERMPPWNANPAHGKFANDARLSDVDKKLIYDWVAAGAPEGDKKQLPEPPQFEQGWRIKTPDQVVYMSERTFNVPAKGEVKYQYFIVDPGFKEDKWIQQAECRPGNRAIVHHIIVGVVPPGRRSDSATGLDSEWLTANAPGARPLLLEEGMAKFIPKGSKLAFQMHYTPNGTAQTDRSSVGLVFADPKKVKHEVATHKAANTRFNIPANDGNHKVEADYRFRDNSLMLAMFPHMHLRGKAFRYEAFYPNGKSEVLLDVPKYDFNWQHAYAFEQPKLMPAGTRIHCTAYFDNSTENLANPDPKSRVKWGDQTWEEMMIGYFDMTLADQDLSKPRASRTDKFVAAYKAGKNTPDKKLIELATGAAKDEAKFRDLGTELRSQFPQLDRMCLTTLNGETIDVKFVLQEPALRKTIGAAGIKVPAKGTSIGSAIANKDTVVHDDLDKADGLDLKLMARGVASSMHVPVKVGDASGTINFWSTEKKAFPPEAVKLLEEIAREMVK